MKITSEIQYIGVNDYGIDLFEGMYKVPNGMAYNSYVILDEKIAIVDTVDKRFTSQWLEKIRKILGKRKPDYLIVQHMEPDHSANIMNLVKEYPNVVVVASPVAFRMMQNYFGTDFIKRRIVVSEGDILLLGKHQLEFINAPMVHWPEVIVTYDCTDKILFSADAFGKFGTVESEIFHSEEDWIAEARRYYIGIVGRFGVQVQNLLKKLKDKEIQKICPLHGPVLSENLNDYLNLYHTWSSYQSEKEGIFIAYTSVYGNTEEAVLLLEKKLREKGCEQILVKDLARCDLAEAVADAFCYSKVVFATTTYNADVFPIMGEFIKWLIERNFSNREVAFIENGSWAPMAGRIMREQLEMCEGIHFLEANVKVIATLNEESIAQVELLAEELCKKQ